jgi:hypothetical protein
MVSVAAVSSERTERKGERPNQLLGLCEGCKQVLPAVQAVEQERERNGRIRGILF